MRQLLVLDRDGVINEDSPNFIRSLGDWRPIPGSIEAIAALSRAGYTVVVATNQSGVARGYLSMSTLQAIHQALCESVQRAGGEVNGIYVCPHGPDAGCDCRKPLPGLLDQIARDFDTTLNSAALVGDSLRDLQAARARGLTPLLVRTGNGRATEQALAGGALGDAAVRCFDSLRDASPWLIAQLHNTQPT
jgi:D-glycero-D-manno-heptose 1,7-bisphosphate phosphatase